MLLLDLPVETRQRIIEYTLHQEFKKWLQYKPPDADAVLRWPIEKMALITVCRQLYDEAMPVLYGFTRFQIPAEWFITPPREFVPRNSVSMIRNVEISHFSSKYDCFHTTNQDDQLSAWIGFLGRHCPYLKSLHFLITYDDDPSTGFVLEDVEENLGWESKTAWALSELRRPRQFTMTVIDYQEYIPENTYEDLRYALAPDASWHKDWKFDVLSTSSVNGPSYKFSRSWTLA